MPAVGRTSAPRGRCASRRSVRRVTAWTISPPISRLLGRCHGPHADISPAGPNHGRRAAAPGDSGRARIPRRFDDGQWITQGSEEGKTCGRTNGGQGLHDTPQHRAHEGAMSRRSRGPRLWLRRAQYDPAGRLTHAAVLLIKDGQYRKSTGCGTDDRRGAEAALAAYISNKHLAEAQAGVRPPAHIPVADVLALYARDVAPKHSRPRETAQRIAALLGYFGDKVLSEINGTICRAYVEHRGSSAAARRELEDLRASIHHHRRGGMLF